MVKCCPASWNLTTLLSCVIVLELSACRITRGGRSIEAQITLKWENSGKNQRHTGHARSRSGRTDRWPGGDDKFLLRSRGDGRAADLGHAFLHHLFHLIIVQQGERDLVHPQVGALRRPRHLLESHVGVRVLLSGHHGTKIGNAQRGTRSRRS